MMRVQGNVIATENCAATMRPELGRYLVSRSPAGGETSSGLYHESKGTGDQDRGRRSSMRLPRRVDTSSAGHLQACTRTPDRKT